MTGAIAVVPAFVGVGGGLGALLVVRGLFPPAPPLNRTIRRMQRAGITVAAHRLGSTSDSRPWVARRAIDLLAGRLGTRVQVDLAVVERSADSFAASKLATAVALGGVVVGFAATLQLAGVPLQLGFTLMLAIAATAVGFVVPDLVVKAEASRRREAFRHALSSFLDLVNVLLAGGAGIETSLEAAAAAGDGRAFVQIRNSLLRARTMRQSPWESLEELGQRLDVVELVDIAASVRLAGEQGARVKASLAAKAVALRAQQMARVEAAANSATERMGLPTVLMFLGFMVLLGYPAMQQIVRAL